MNKYIKSDIEQGLKYLRVGTMNALADIEQGREENIVLGEHVPFSLVVNCAKERDWTHDENQSFDWTNGWEINCWWYMWTPDNSKKVCISSSLWGGQQTELEVVKND